MVMHDDEHSAADGRLQTAVRRITCAILRIPGSDHNGLNHAAAQAQRREVAARMMAVQREIDEDADPVEVAERAIEDADALLKRLRDNGGV